MGGKIYPPGFHIVEEGEWISKLAKWYGIPDWKTIWNHPNNSKLREERESPNILFPGDKVFIPEIETKEESGATEKEHKFVIKDDKIIFQTTILDEDNKPRPDVPYTLKVDKIKFEGKTDSNGLIKHPIPKNAEEAFLEIDDQIIEIQLGYLDPIETVMGLQARLYNLGYEPGEVDGIYGEKTTKAVKTFQEDYPPLVVDGICGPKTRHKLKELYGS
jgi:hypothetical protein